MNCKMLHELTIEILRKYDFHYNPDKIESFTDIYVDKYNEVYSQLMKSCGIQNQHASMSGLQYTLTYIDNNTEL